jgi:hypothetical protein
MFKHFNYAPQARKTIFRKTLNFIIDLLFKLVKSVKWLLLLEIKLFFYFPSILD